MTKEILDSKLQQRKSFYEENISKIDRSSAKKEESILSMTEKQEKLKKSKELLSQLSGLVGERSQKAKEIYEYVSTGKDTTSLMKEVDRINGNIKEVQERLKSIQDLTGSVSICLVDVLGDDIKAVEIGKITKKIDKQLSKISELLVDALNTKEANKSLRTRYLGYIGYIDKSLNGSKLVDSVDSEKLLESDLVYEYAKKEGLHDVVEKMKLRKMGYDEYKNFLLKINPMYAYVIRMLDIANSESERAFYYDLLGKIEKGEISEHEKSELQIKVDKWLLYKDGNGDFLSMAENSKVNTDENNGKKLDEDSDDIVSGDDNEEEGNIINLYEDIPFAKVDSSGRVTDKSIDKIKRFLDSLEINDITYEMIEVLENRGWPRVPRNNEKFKIWYRLQHMEESASYEDIYAKKWGFKGAEEYKEFKSCDHSSDEAMSYIEKGNIEFLLEHLMYFKGLDERVLDKILEYNIKYYEKVLNNYRSFLIDSNNIFIKLLDRGISYKVLLTNFQSYIPLSSEVAYKVVSLGEGNDIFFRNTLREGKFEPLDSDVAIAIMEKWDDGVHFVATHLKYFRNLNVEVRDRIFRTKDYKFCDEYRDRFNFDEGELDGMDVVNKYIEQGLGWKVLKRLDHYKGLDYKNIADKLIDKGQGWLVAVNIRRFDKKFHSYIADKLVEIGCGLDVCKNIQKFEGIDIQKLIYKLIDKGQGWVVAMNLKSFVGIDHVDIANILIDSGQGQYVAQYRNNFKNMNEEIIAKLGKIVDDLSKTRGREIVQHYNFIPLANEETLKNLVGSNPENIVDCLNKFDKKYYNLIAMELIDLGKAELVINNIDKFRGMLNKDVAEKLKAEGFLEFVETNCIKFVGYQGQYSKAVREFLTNLSKEDKEKFLGSSSKYSKHWRQLNLKYMPDFAFAMPGLDNQGNEIVTVMSLPESWNKLIKVLGGRDGCYRRDYVYALLESVEEGKKYYDEHVSSINKLGRIARGVDNVIDYTGILGESHEGDNVVEDSINVLDVKDIKEKLESLGLPNKYIEVLDIRGDGTVDRDDVVSCIEKEGYEWTVRDLCEIFEEAGAEIIGKRESIDELESLEQWGIKEAYSKASMGRIEKFLKLLNVAESSWKLFKSILSDEGEIRRKDLDKWINDTKFKKIDDFEGKLSHFGIRVLDEDENIDFEFDTADEFVEKMEYLGYEFADRGVFIENLNSAFSAVRGLRSGLISTMRRLSQYRQNQAQKEMSPFEKVTSKNTNPKFSVIKIGDDTPVRLVFSFDEKTVLSILNHKDYDKLWQGTKRNMIKLEGIERKIFW